MKNQADLVSWQLKSKETGESGLTRRKINVKHEERFKNTRKLHNYLKIKGILNNVSVTARDGRRITAAEAKYMRITAGYTRTDYKTNTQIAKGLKITPILDKLLEYKRNWIQHVYRMPHNRLPRVMKQYSPTGRRNHGRPLKRLLDT